MTIEQTFTLVTIILTTVNAGVTYFNLRYNRKKDFQDKLYQLKLDAYRDLNEACYAAIQRLDINSTPYVQIYDYDNAEEWEKYCEANMGEEFSCGFDLQKLTYKHSLILPAEIVDKYHEFAGNCISFVTMSFHFDAGLIIENQDKLWEEYIGLLNAFRKDLKVDIVDVGLGKRIAAKI